MERPPFNPGRLDPCFCRSGRRFKNCCGSRAPDRPPPFSVHVIPGFVPEAECRELVTWADEQVGDPMTVVDTTQKDASKERGRASTARITEEVALGDRAEQVHGWMERAIREHIEPAFQREIAWFEAPDLMRYGPGGWFKRHADSEYFDEQRKCWVKILDREISLLIYLNGDFEGGELSFPVFNWNYRPRAGDLLFFPSDARFQHEAQAVTRGRRYALVSWMAVKNAPRVNEGIPRGAIQR